MFYFQSYLSNHICVMFLGHQGQFPTKHVDPVCLAITVPRLASPPHLGPVTPASTAQEDLQQPHLGVISQVTGCFFLPFMQCE